MELVLLGSIGGDVKASDIANRLKMSKGALTIKLNSYGGDVFEGQAIHNILRDYKGFVTCEIIGICASAATLIAMACDKIVMKSNANFMIHEASISLSQIMQKDDLSKLISALEKINEGIIEVYSARTKISKEELRTMLKEETWMNAEEAKEKRFIDEISAIETKNSSYNEKMLAALKTKFVEEERARVAKLNSVETTNPATRAILNVAIENGQTLEEIQPFLDAIGKTNAEAAVVHKNTNSASEFIAQLKEYFDSGATEIRGGSIENTKNPVDDVLEIMNRRRGE